MSFDFTLANISESMVNTGIEPLLSTPASPADDEPSGSASSSAPPWSASSPEPASPVSMLERS